jgi:hypothetical protein
MISCSCRSVGGSFLLAGPFDKSSMEGIDQLIEVEASLSVRRRSEETVLEVRE